MNSVVHAFSTEVIPSEIHNGDAFLVKVKDTETFPEASFKGRRLFFNKCGDGCYMAIGAVGLKTSPGTYRIIVKDGKERSKVSLNVKAAKFSVLRITLPEKKVFLSPEDLERAEQEEKRLMSIWQKISEKFWEGSFIYPLENELSTQFGTKRIINKKKISIHGGLDIRGKEGDEIRASNKGKVVLAEGLFFGGNTVILDHGQGIFTVYMHLSGFNVKQGDDVSRGDIIGFVGSTGRSSGPHLHFGVKVFDISVNPVTFLKLQL
jgi:murein DD-endopeptidase MepM/ murein hydrolase activator NlpD